MKTNLTPITVEQWFASTIPVEDNIEAQARREVADCAREGRLLDYDDTVAYLRAERVRTHLDA